MADSGGINPAFAAKLNALIAASGGRVTIGNSYRSVAQQQALFDAAVKKYGSVAAARHWVALPGHSKHNEGLAADLRGDLAWAHAHAAEFGLVFPLSHEKWHVELVGARGPRSANASTTPPQGYADGPGNPDALAALADTGNAAYGTIEGQLANLVAAISMPTPRVF